MKWELYSHNMSNFALDRGISVLNLMLKEGNYVILDFCGVFTLLHVFLVFG